MLSFLSAATASAASADTTQTGLSPVPKAGVVDYVLGAPGFVLKLPVRLLAYLAQGPIELVEHQGLLPRIQSLFALRGPHGIRPTAGYKSRTGLRGGLKISTGNFLRSGLPARLSGTMSTNQYRLFLARLGGRRMWSGRFGVAGEVGWEAHTRDPFYGLGSATSLDDQVNYGYRGAFGGLKVFYDPSSLVSVTGFLQLRRVKPENGRDHTTPHDRDSITALFAGQNLFGLFTDLNLHELGVDIALDWRDHPGSPRRGGTDQLTVSYVAGDGPGDTTVGYFKIRGELTQYLNIYNGRVIGIRIMAEHTDRDAGSEVPFYDLAHLGGSKTMRGYKTGRFTGPDFALFTVEYRWPIWRVLDAVVFTDQGRIFDDLADDFEFSAFRSSYGGGLRMWNDAGHAEILLTKAPRENLRIYFSIGESF